MQNQPIAPAMLASQMMPVPAPFIVGDHLALDFLNTIAAPRDAPIEWIGCGADLLDWLHHVGVLDGTEVARIVATFSACDLDAIAVEAMSLREWFREVLGRIKQNGRAVLAPADLARLNATLSHDATVARLEMAPDGKGLQLVSRHAWLKPAELLVPIASAMADLLSEGETQLVRRCENPVCTLWFYDRTKGHRRRWCSQAVCGNRAKVAAFRVRKRLER
jgi:predicted RNA-binding Zn ribbon-like protein